MIRLSAILAALAFGFTALATSGCNTIHGVGRDIEAAGRTIANLPDGARDDHRRKRRAKAAKTQPPRPAAQTTAPRSTTTPGS